MPLATAAEGIGMLKDVVLTIAAAVGMLVAVSGLTTWNRQLKGGVEYELTRRLLKCTYLLREAIKGVRHPVMFMSEQKVPDSADIPKTPEEKRFAGLSYAYKMRWEKVDAARDALQTELLEAEVVWDKEVYVKFQPLFDLQRELSADVFSYLSLCSPYETQISKDSWQKIRRERRDVLYDSLGAKPDAFSSDVIAAIGEIESHLKLHLKK